MRIISCRTLRAFQIQHPRVHRSLDDWYRLVESSVWETPADVKRASRSADFLPDNRIVFNIAGNECWLVVKVEYQFQTVYIRFVGTHAEYDKIDATSI